VSIGSAKVVAEIAEISSRIWGSITDRNAARKEKERVLDERVKELEKQLAELKKKEEKL